jgi:hypothetical protein
MKGLPDFSGVTVKSPNYRQLYLRCLSVLQETLDAKTLKTHALRYARDHKIEPKNAFGALEDWRYTTIGKVAYLEQHDFPLTEDTKKWLETKVNEIITEGKEAIKNNKVVVSSPVIEKSDKKLTPVDMATKIIALVENGDKLLKDREAPVKLLSIEGATKDQVKEVLSTIETRFSMYSNETSDGYKTMVAQGTMRSTMIRRRNEFGRLVQQISTYLDGLTK